MQSWVDEESAKDLPVAVEHLAHLGDPTVFSPAERIISLSRGNNSPMLDMTVEQAQIVAERLLTYVAGYGTPERNKAPV